MGRNGIPLDKAELLSTLLEGILYGFSLLMFGETIWVLVTRRSTQRVNRAIFIVACLLLFCSTVHLVIDIVRIMEGLILKRDTYPGGPIALLADVSHWTFVSKNYLYAVQTLIGDGVILYRCYVVWQSKYVMIFPALLWCASAVTGFACPLVEWQMTSGDRDDIFCKILSKWIKAFYGTAFTTNFVTTCMLVYRIWYLDQQTAKLRGHSTSQLGEILHTILDAGVIYFLALLAWMICFSLRTNGQFVVLNMLVPIISITFYMVIVRVGLMSHRTNQPNNGLPRNDDKPFESINSFWAARGERMQVHITTIREQKYDDGHRSPGGPGPTISVDFSVRQSKIKANEAIGERAMRHHSEIYKNGPPCPWQATQSTYSV